MARTDTLEVEGRIVERLPNETFQVELPNRHRVLAYCPRKVQSECIRLLPGDKVLLEMNAYDLTKGRIAFRQK